MIPKSLQLIKLPFAIFFAARDFGDKITLSSRLRDSTAGLLDGDPMILPVPQGAPADVPRVQLQSKDRSLLLQLSTVRLALEWNHRGGQAHDWKTGTQDYFKALAGLLRLFAGEYAEPTRFVFNPQFVLPMSRSANDYLATELFAPGRIRRRPFSCRLGLMDRIEVAGQPMAVWMNLATARQREQPDRDNALVLQFEMQSQEGRTRPFTGDEIMAVLAETESLMATRIREVVGDLFEGEREKRD